jgi:hypothetical protein
MHIDHCRGHVLPITLSDHRRSASDRTVKDQSTEDANLFAKLWAGFRPCALLGLENWTTARWRSRSTLKHAELASTS